MTVQVCVRVCVWVWVCHKWQQLLSRAVTCCKFEILFRECPLTRFPVLRFPEPSYQWKFPNFEHTSVVIPVLKYRFVIGASLFCASFEFPSFFETWGFFSSRWASTPDLLSMFNFLLPRLRSMFYLAYYSIVATHLCFSLDESILICDDYIKNSELTGNRTQGSITISVLPQGIHLSVVLPTYLGGILCFPMEEYTIIFLQSAKSKVWMKKRKENR